MAGLPVQENPVPSPRVPTTKYISSNIFLEIITMLNETCITLAMRAAALGHSLAEAQCLAAAALLGWVLLCTFFGYPTVLPDEARPAYRGVLRVYRALSPGMRGILPAPAGIAGSSRTLLHE